MGETFGRQVKPFKWEWAVLSKQQPQPRTRSKIIYFSCFNKCLVHMAGDRGKRKAWMHCKNAKTPRTTAGEAKLLKKGTLVNVSRLIHQPECWLILKKVFSLSCVFEINSILRFLNETDSSTQPPISTKESGDSDPANLKVEDDNFLPFFCWSREQFYCLQLQGIIQKWHWRFQLQLTQQVWWRARWNKGQYWGACKKQWQFGRW